VSLNSVHLHRKRGTRPCQLCRDKTAAQARRYRKARYLRGRLMVPSVGTQRRIRALSRMGWTQRQVASRLGMTPWSLNKLLTTQLVRRDTAGRVAVLYRHLCGQAPAGDTVAWTRRWAELRGWAGPADWDGAQIDDPAAVPLCEIERCHAEALQLEQERRAEEAAARRLARARPRTRRRETAAA
jgi:AraC-like DNA-binding protein